MEINNNCIKHQNIETTPDYRFVTFYRTIAVILVVVIQHGLAPFSTSWSFVTGVPQTFLSCLDFISLVVNTLTMPSLVFISGFLFSLLYQRNGKYKKVLRLIQNKFNRLLLPAYIFGALFSLTLSHSISILGILDGPYHLWYLSSLFWCFCLAPLLVNENIGYKKVILIIGLSFCFIYSGVPSIIGLQGFSHYFFYFVIGVYLAKYWEQVYTLLSSRCIRFSILAISVTALFLILFTCNAGYSDYHLFNNPYEKIVSPLLKKTYCVSFLILSVWYCSRIHIKGGRFYEIASSNSFGLYIFHMWLMWLPFKIDDVNTLLTPWASAHYIIFTILYIVIAFSLSIGLTMLLKKTSVGSMLLK